MTSYVFDSYAVIEMLEGNRSYVGYVDESGIINDFILAELAYHFLKTYGKRTADLYAKKYAQYSMNIPVDTIVRAAEFRLKHRGKRLSMTDCISYMQARSLGIKFLIFLL